jgi:hypothetical protein
MAKIIHIFRLAKVVTLPLIILLSIIEISGRNKVLFVGNQDNDQYSLLQSNGIEIIHYDYLENAGIKYLITNIKKMKK